MIEALDAAQRTILEKLVLRCRHLLETDLAQELERRYGIQKSGVIEAESSLTLDASALESRRDLESVVRHLRSEGESAGGSVQRLVREAAFTQLNRLVAVRIAEAIGMLPETLSGGIESAGFRDFREVARLAGSDDWDRFRLFLGLCADELAADVPALFDPRNPVLVLQPSVPTLVDLVETIAAAPAAVWDAPDTLGWVYQFFNTGDERRAMREASGAPRDSRELAVRNQFFTPRYVVDFLVQNGLGAHLATAIPELVDDLPYLVEAPTEHEALDLHKISVLDPACGSGHFLLGAYDILERAWELSGVPPAESAPAIISSLWGIDIDPRCTQIAQAAIVFRARRHCREADLPQTNIICARALPTGPETEDLVANLPDGVGRAVRTISDELETAPILGSLLKIEERLEHEIRASVFGGQVVDGTLAASIEGDAFTAIESQVLGALTAISDAATSTAAERLFAAEATDAVRFVEAMRRRYTAVLMNPPFGEPVPDTKPYLKAAYPWIPTKDHNLFAAFVGRGLQLAEEQIGTCSAITSRSGMFLKTFEKWRKSVLLGSQLVALTDLGYGVMEQALVEAAAYVLRRQDPVRSGVFVRMLKDTDRANGLAEACASALAGDTDPRIFVVSPSDFEAIPGSPVAYWMSPSVRRLFGEYPSLEGHGAVVRQGLATGDDFRFVRAFWEVDPRRVGRTESEVQLAKRWVPFAKGGEYSPYWADVHLVVDWENNGERIRGYQGSRPQNVQHYFKPGLTWSLRTASAFSPRVLPAGCIFSNKGNVVLSDEPLSLLPWLSSRAGHALLAVQMPAADETTSGGASKSYEVGIVGRVPWPEDVGIVSAAFGRAMALRRRAADQRLETSRTFVAPSLHEPHLAHVRRLDIACDQIEDGERAEEAMFPLLGLDSDGLKYLDTEVGCHPARFPNGDGLDDEVAELYVRPLDRVIDELIKRVGGSRVIASMSHIADRRLEVIAHGLQVNPRTILRVVEERDLLPPEEPAASYRDQLSYLVGCSFGRWDLRIARDPSLAVSGSDLFDPVPLCSPGTLVGPDGLPAKTPPDGYPISVPSDHLLLDEPGHHWDLERRMRIAAQVVLDDSESSLAAMMPVLEKRSLRHYLQAEFFKDHLSLYTVSRRAAPIYWQLSVPSRFWGVWVYAPALSRETLFAVVREAERRERLAADLIRQLSAEREAGGAGRSVTEVAKALDAEEKLAEELRVFRREAERIAHLGWVPDLDDGAVLNAAPLADLFPAWKKAAEYRDELRAGKYEWASVARWGDRL